MNKVKIILALLISIHFSASANNSHDSSVAFERAHVFLNIPEPRWAAQPPISRNGMMVYLFKREAVMDGQHRKVIPNIGVIIEDVSPGEDIVNYTIRKREGNRFEVAEVFTHREGKINFINAIGYKCTYKDKASIDHTVFVVHAINNKKGIQIILDTTTSTFPALEDEFLAILKSLRK